MPKINKFKYNKTIDKKIIKAVQAVLGVQVINGVKMGHGEVNHVYKIIATDGDYLARIFQYRSWPEDGKLQWIETHLTKHKIPHAKILYFSRSQQFFPFGFMISEFLEGPNGNQAVKLKKISLARAFYETGKVLKKIHRVKLKKFGRVPPKEIGESDFVEYTLMFLKSKLNFLEHRKVIKPGLYPLIEKEINQAIGPLNKLLYPVLVHSDANRENAILTPKEDWVLVDWDNAYAGNWLEDYAGLTYWVDWDRKPAHAKRIHTLINKNFFKGYGSGLFSQEQIAKIEHALHITKAIGMMIYYNNFKKSPKELKKTKIKLFKLLK